jgi:hypothetical protein
VTVELYKDVALTQDVPEHQLKAGDVATLVDLVPHPDDGEEGCVLEVFNAIGESITVVVVPISAIKALQANEILSIRPLASAS